jgi:UDP-glucose 4-epimerase
MHKIIVTGATGMIGSAIVRYAIAQNIDVVCIVHKDSERISNIPKSPHIQILYADLPCYESYNPQITNCDTFIHLAWDKTAGKERDDSDIQVKNIKYTLDAVRLAQRMGCSVFVGAGSQAEYGPSDCDLAPDTPVHPESGYGIAKYAAGKMSALLCSQLGIRQNWIRILSVYGPNDAQHTLISYVIEELKHERIPELTKCEQLWDYLYCDDAARAILAVAEKGKSGKVYPLGSGQGRRLSEYIKTMHDAIAPEIEIRFGRKEYYPHQPMHLVADITELTNDTGWKPIIKFEEGIKYIISSQH